MLARGTRSHFPPCIFRRSAIVYQLMPRRPDSTCAAGDLLEPRLGVGEERKVRLGYNPLRDIMA